MIKYYCDFCKKELSEEECYFIRIPIPTDTVIKTYYMIPLQEYLTKGMKIESRHICFSCGEKLANKIFIFEKENNKD